MVSGWNKIHEYKLNYFLITCEYNCKVGSFLPCVLPVASCCQVQLTTQKNHEGLSRLGAVKNGGTMNRHPVCAVHLHILHIDYTMPGSACFGNDL